MPGTGSRTPKPVEPQPAEAQLEDAVAKELEAEKEKNKDLADQLARALARQEVEQEEREARELERGVLRTAPLDPTDPGPRKEGTIVIHFVSDGHTALDKVFVRGDEAEFDPNDPEDWYQDTLDRYGNSWVNLTEGEQLDKWGVVRFRPGPWRGKSLADSRFEQLKALAAEEGFSIPDTAQLAAAERAQRADGRKSRRIPNSLS